MPVTAPPIATTEAVPAVASPIRLFRPGERSAVDAYGREMTYLRISLTDRCNFRCVYCMPAIGMKFQPRDEMLTDEELIDSHRRVLRNRLHQIPPDRRRADRFGHTWWTSCARSSDSRMSKK